MAGGGYLGPAPLSAAGEASFQSATLSRLSSPPGLNGPAPTPERTLLDQYCVTCHNNRLKTGGMSLQAVNVEQISADAPTWEKVVRKLRSGAMPPVGMPRPAQTAVNSFISYLERALDREAAAAPNPGWLPVHRLNRAEYANAVRDVLGLEVDASELLAADDAAYGFDNNAAILSMSPGLLARYMSAARKISRLAVGDVTMRPVFDVYNVPKFLVQDTDRMSEDLPFGSVGGIAIRHYFPVDGEYVARIVVSGRDPVEVRLDGTRIAVLTPAKGATAENSGPTQEVRFAARAGTRLLGLSFVEKTTVAELFDGVGYTNSRRAKNGVNRVDIGGPYNAISAGDTPARRQIFVCRPSSRGDEEPCARRILTTLARRAYRRPVTDQDVQTLLTFYTAARGQGQGFEAGIRRALVMLLVSPDFLFRLERDPANLPAVHRVSDVELASRLSFFLWSSVPDDELLQVAELGRLREPGVLEQQVRRMLNDPRASALVTSFAVQWLYLRNLRAATPDAYQFPEFDDNLRDAMRQETELFVESQLREDRPLLDLLRANYTFLNERLARHYGVPHVFGSDFRRVTVTDDQRIGLLGQASLLTVTSYAHRTSVVQRGKWILENILGAPPPPPPPNIPALPENTRAVTPRTLRERMETHRKNPACSVCHASMDPVGFALENFDAIGGWRTRDAGAPIDASGTLPDGTTLNGPADLRRALLEHGDQVVAAVTEKLLTYALGRGLEYFDQPAVRQILREAAPTEYRWSAMILGIVKSTPFQMRMRP